MIFIPQTVTDLDAPEYFATKRTGIEVLFLNKIAQPTGFCSCIIQCVPCLPMFTDKIGLDFFKNDTFLQYINVASSGTTTVTLTKIAPDGSETNIIVTDGTYGALTDGSASSPRYFTYTWDFFKIFNVEGFGKFQFKLENKNVAGKVISVDLSPVFCLQFFTAIAANRTIRIESVKTGKLKHGNDYGSLFFAQQIRLPGRLVYLNEITENDDQQLNNNKRSLVQIKDQVFPEYQLQIHLVSAPQIVRTMFDYLFAGDVKISDYNVNNFVVDPADMNACQYLSIPLKKTITEFNPSGTNIRKSFNFTMEYANKNVFKTNN